MAPQDTAEVESGTARPRGFSLRPDPLGSQAFAMRPGRLELPRAIRPTRPSTLRVYQFRHRRVAAADYRATDMPSDGSPTMRTHVRSNAHSTGGSPSARAPAHPAP